MLDQQSLQIKAMGSRVFPVGCENFVERKTGWLSHNPIKVLMNSIRKLEYKDEFNLFIKLKKPTYEVIPFRKCPCIVMLYLESIKN